MPSAASPLPFDPVAKATENWARSYGEVPRMRAVTSLMRVHQLVISGLDDLLRPLGLTFARFEVLVLLSFSRTGILAMGTIGQRLQVHPTSVTSLVQRLADAGLIVRVPDESDRRVIRAQLTDAGREVLAVAVDLITTDEFCLSSLSDDEANQLSDLLIAPRREAGDFA